MSSCSQTASGWLAFNRASRQGLVLTYNIMAAAGVAWQALEHGDVLVLANGGEEEPGTCTQNGLAIFSMFGTL